jgi:hypothetical protein
MLAVDPSQMGVGVTLSFELSHALSTWNLSSLFLCESRVDKMMVYVPFGTAVPPPARRRLLGMLRMLPIIPLF